jgi:hypothetical protein
VKRLSAFCLVSLFFCLGLPANAATYGEPIIDFRMHGNLNLRISQGGTLVDEVYGFLSRAVGFVHLIADEEIEIELTSEAPSNLAIIDWGLGLPSTNKCSLKVGIGVASGRPLEEDPSRWLGEIPLELTWEESKFQPDWGPKRFNWRASASGSVSSPLGFDKATTSELQFHVICDGQVVSTFSYYFFYGIQFQPFVPEPQLSLRNNLAVVNLGRFDTYDPVGKVKVVFSQCGEDASACSVFAVPKEYLSSQIKGPLEFQLKGLTGTSLKVTVEMSNKYATISKSSQNLVIAGTISKKFTLPNFALTATKPSSSQKAKIKAELLNLDILTTVQCVAYTFASQSKSEKTKAIARAKEVCLYVKSLVPGVSTTFAAISTKAKSNAGKVILDISN